MVAEDAAVDAGGGPGGGLGAGRTAARVALGREGSLAFRPLEDGLLPTG